MNKNSSLLKPELNKILFTIYLCIAVFAYFFVYVTVDGLKLLLIMIPAVVVLYVLCCLLFLAVRKLKPRSSVLPAGRASRIVFAVTSAIAFAVMMVWFAAFFPGSFGIDATDQFAQVVDKTYTNVHPAWHTIVFYCIPLKVFRWRKWSIVLLQMLYFALTMGYLSEVLYRYAGIAYSVIACAFILLNPWIGFMMLCPMKDVAFAIAGALSMIMAAESFLSKGEWSTPVWKCILLGIMLANAAIFRHNGILFSAFLMLALIVVLKRKQWLIILLSFVLMFVFVKGPVYRLFHVDTSPQEVVQVVGLPMTIMANVFEETPEKMDNETLEFMLSVAPEEKWHEQFYLGNFCAMKYVGGIDETVIEEAGTAKIFKMGLKCFTYSPKASWRALFALTDIVYGLDLEDEGKLEVGTPENSYGLYTRYHETLAPFLRNYYEAVKCGGYNYTRQSAFALTVLLCFMLARCNIKDKDGRRRLLMCLPILAYDFGTMLLLTWADARFFFITYPVCPVVVLIALYGGVHER
ncbi:hypothetical protein SAMN02910292_00811 [Lachnospiraceae bacterium XBB2008]|nr:hypothetical protein SAMN02910292_00811 [Lachnospiraceae bacterium XBB2008]